MEEKLSAIYESFADLLIEKGWKGKLYGWKESSRYEVVGTGWSQFELDNGFKMKISYLYPEEEPQSVILQYWFSHKPERVDVESLEQLMLLLV